MAALTLWLPAALLPHAVKAQETTLMIGPWAIYAPDYEGSDDYEVQPFPFIVVDYDDVIFVEGDKVGTNVLRLQPSEETTASFGPLAHYRRDRPEDCNGDLQGLGDVGISVERGGFLRLDQGDFWLLTEGGKDVADGHGEIVARLEAGMQQQLADKLSQRSERQQADASARLCGSI